MFSPAPPTSLLVGRGGEPRPHFDHAESDAYQSEGPCGGRDERLLGALVTPATPSRRSARPTQRPSRTIPTTINQGDS